MGGILRIPHNAKAFARRIDDVFRRGQCVPQTNALIAKECAKGKDLTFVDITSVTLDSSGQIRSGIFLADGLHLNRKGYELWRDVLRPVLIKAELKYEKGKGAAEAGATCVTPSEKASGDGK